MKSIFKFLISLFIVLIVVLAWEFTSKFGLIPSLGIFTPRNTQIDESPVVVEEVREIAQLLTQSYYDEIFYDTGLIKKGFLQSDKRLSIISEGIVKAGFNLSRLNENSVINEDGTLVITLPAPEILSVTSNPSQKEIFIAQGNFTQQEQNRVNHMINRQLEENAIRKRILQRSAKQGKRTVEKLLKLFGFENVEVRVEKSPAEKKAREILDAAYQIRYKKYEDIESEDYRMRMKLNLGPLMRGNTDYVITEQWDEEKGFQRSLITMEGKLIYSTEKTPMQDEVYPGRAEKYLVNIITEPSVYNFIRDVFKTPEAFDFYFIEDIMMNDKNYAVMYAFDEKDRWRKIFVNKKNYTIEIIEDFGPYLNQREVRDFFLTGFSTIKGLPVPHRVQIFIQKQLFAEYNLKTYNFND